MPDSWTSRFLIQVRALAGQSVARRLAGGTAANFLGKFWVLAVQLATIPVLTQKWGVEGYGVWLMISTIPTYIALADLGLGAAAGVEITRKVAKSDYRGALDAFQSVWVALTGAVAVIAALVISYAASIYTAEGGAPGRFAHRDLAIAIVVITVYAGFVIQMNILNMVFRATHKYAFGTLVMDSLLPFEGVALVVMVWFGGGVVEAASALLIVRVFGWLVFRMILLAREPWLRLGFKRASWPTLRPLLNPSLATLALTLANALILQGLILALGWAAGAAVVAVFGASRMLTRIPLQFSSLVWRASIPELTRSQVAGDSRTTRNLLAFNTGFAIVATVLPLLVLAVFGPKILEFVSGGSLSAPSFLFVFLAMAAFSNAVWMAAASPLVALNRQARFSYHYVILCAFVAAIPFLPSHDPSIVTAAGHAVAELGMLVIVGRMVVRSMAGGANEK